MSFQGFKVRNLENINSMLHCFFSGNIVPVRCLSFPKDCEQLNVAEQWRQLGALCAYKLQELNLPVTRMQSQSVDDIILGEISKFSDLRRINLSTHGQVTDKGVALLAFGCPNLTHVILDHCKNVTADAIVNLMRSCPRLIQVSALLSASCVFTSSHLNRIAPYCQYLESAGMDWGMVDNLQSIIQFAKNAHNLKQLHIRGCVSITGECLTKLVSTCAKLQQLRVICSADFTNIVNPVIKNDYLVEFFLSNCEQLSNMIVECPNLRKLHLDSIQTLHSVTIKQQDNPHLTELILRSSRLEGLQAEQFLTSGCLPSTLQFIEIFDCTGIPKLNIASSSLQELKLFMCSDLEELYIQSSSLKKFSIDICMQLRSSELIDCNSLILCQWFSLPQMQAPIIDRLILKSSSLESLSLQKCVNLRQVTLDCHSLTSVNMSECKVLEQLSLSCINLQKLALSAPRINFSPHYIQQMCRSCPQVNMLHIANVLSMTDASLEQICACWNKNLTAIIVSNCASLEKPIISLPLLRGLQFCDCENLRFPRIQHCPSLGKIFFKGDPNLCDEALQLLNYSNAPQLRYIEVSDCRNIKTPSFAHPELFELHLYKCPNVTQITISPTCTRLVKLYLSEMQKLGRFTIGQLPSALVASLMIGEIILSNCSSLDDRNLTYLTSLCPYLIVLIVNNCHSLRYPIFNSCRSLKHVQFNNCQQLIKPVFIACASLQIISFKLCPHLIFNDNIGELIFGQSHTSPQQHLSYQPSNTNSIPPSFTIEKLPSNLYSQQQVTVSRQPQQQQITILLQPPLQDIQAMVANRQRELVPILPPHFQPIDNRGIFFRQQ